MLHGFHRRAGAAQCRTAYPMQGIRRSPLSGSCSRTGTLLMRLPSERLPGLSHFSPRMRSCIVIASISACRFPCTGTTGKDQPGLLASGSRVIPHPTRTSPSSVRNPRSFEAHSCPGRVRREASPPRYSKFRLFPNGGMSLFPDSPSCP